MSESVSSVDAILAGLVPRVSVDRCPVCGDSLSEDDKNWDWERKMFTCGPYGHDMVTEEYVPVRVAVAAVHATVRDIVEALRGMADECETEPARAFVWFASAEVARRFGGTDD